MMMMMMMMMMVSTEMGVPFACIPSWNVASHTGQLSLLPLAGWEMSTSQQAVAALFGWEGNRRIGVALATRHTL